ncbi:MAG: sigma-70 family RNA polymerase sigma factor [Saprospiraceae bacterium]|nr:sigma-70 family RNA polymerase sigma factor [Saprospiraceae bacterium]
MNNQRSQGIVDHLFRHEYGKMVSVLIRVFGPSQLNMIEDVVQEAFIKAVMTWRAGKIPDNPAAWLHRVARNKAIDRLRNIKSRNERNIKYQSWQPIDEKIDTYLDTEIEDSQLRMIFTCCNLDLNESDKLALTLKFISGFGNKEIAKALMTKEETIKKRLHRARKKLKEQDQTVDIPTGKELHSLLNIVHKVIYLIFNEGYHSIKQDQLIRKDLCAEAMRLCKIVTDHPYCKTEAGYALMALMCYHAARLDSRMSHDHDIILLKDQDRSKWHQPLIIIGNRYFGMSSKADKFSPYHIEAAIAAQHSRSLSYKDTDWKILEKLYGVMNEVITSSMSKLCLAICRKENADFKGALSLLESLQPSDFYPNPYLFHAVAADIYQAIDRSSLAIEHLRSSLENAPTEAERKLIVMRLNDFNKASG